MLEKPKARVIIADDNTVWCNSLKKYLEQNTDIEVVGITNDGEQQIAMIKTLKPDIVITDLKRENGISGIEVIKKCNEQNVGKVKFLVETGSYYKDQMDLLKSMGIKHILYKPFVLDNIMEKIIEIQNEEIKNLVSINNELSEKRKSILDIIRTKLKQLRISIRKD